MKMKRRTLCLRLDTSEVFRAVHVYLIHILPEDKDGMGQSYHAVKIRRQFKLRDLSANYVRD